MGKISTIKVEFLKGGTGNINATDFDSKKHKRIEEELKNQKGESITGKDEVPTSSESIFSKQERDGTGWYDVVNAGGTAQNESALRSRAADALIKKLG